MNYKNEPKKLLIKNLTISIVCSIFFIVVLYFIFEDGFGKKGSSGVSGFIEQDNLRKSLGDWYQLVFYTFQVNLYFLILGISYFWTYKNNVIKNMFFCSICFLLFCFFAMAVFNFKSFKTNQYEAAKTVFVHFLIPISSFIILFFIRKEIDIKWKVLWLNSLYLVFYIIMCVAIYYSVDFTNDSQYPGKPLWIYGFLDFNNQIMFVPMKNMIITGLGITTTLLICPIIGMSLFLFFKFIYNIKIEKLKPRKRNRTL